MLEGAWADIGGCEEREGGGAQRAGGEGKAGPFDDFAEIVGRGDKAEAAAMRDFITRLARAAQIAQNMVGVQIQPHAEKEQAKADIEERGGEPAFGQVGSLGDAPAIDRPVHGVEQDGHCAGCDRFFAGAANAERVDERAIGVVAEKHRGEDELDRAGAACAQEEDQEHERGDGFHDHPDKPLIDLRPPFFALIPTIRRGDKQ